MNKGNEPLETTVTDRSVGYLLRRASRYFHNHTVPVLKENGLSPLELTTLSLVQNNPDCILRSLAEAVGVEPPAMNRIMNSLEEKRLVIRRKSRQDARYTYFRVSDAGDDCIKKASGEVMAVEERLLSHLTPAERKEIIRVMSTLR